MNNATKGILFALLATLLWSGNMVVASGISHIPPLVWLFGAGPLLALCWHPCFKSISTISKLYGIILHTLHLQLYWASPFNTLIYFAGKTTSAVNLSLIAISIPLFIVVLSRIILKEKISNIKITICNNHYGSFGIISKGSFSSSVTNQFCDWRCFDAFGLFIFCILYHFGP
jgi:drug/metabolite transporter (DMT)-like permease